ncbi:reverse transcriptase domain-containing protein [Tanacetum coccineum]
MVQRKIHLVQEQSTPHPNSLLFGSNRTQPNLCINKLAPSVGSNTRNCSIQNERNGKLNSCRDDYDKNYKQREGARRRTRVNIQDFCEEHYKDILPIIMEKARHDKRKEVQTRLNFGENPKKARRERENSLNSRAENSPTSLYPERSRTHGRERRDGRNVFSRLSHRQKSVHERLSETYSPSTTKSESSRSDPRNPSRSRGRPLSRGRSQREDRFRGTEESYDDTYSGMTKTKYSEIPQDEDRSHKGKRWRDSESPSSHGSGSGSSNGGHWKSKTKRRKRVEEDDLAVPWTCEDVDPFIPRIRNFKSSRRTRMPPNVKTYDGTGDPEDHLKIFQAAAQVERWAMPTWCHMFNSTLLGAARVWFDELPPESIDGYKGLKAAFLAYFMQQKKYVKDPVEIHNIKQKDGETIEEFMERFKIETGRMKGAPECMRISGFMHGVNNPELTKRLNEHVPKTMEEMMTVTTAFIRRETVASKKKGHLPRNSQDQSKRHAPDRKSDFRGQTREGRVSNKFTPLTRTPKEILAAESGKFQPPPPMVTPVEKRSSNKFCEFHKDKGHSTNECMHLKRQIEELIRAGKLSHLVKEVKQNRDRTKNDKKEAPAKDKSFAIYMIQSWQRMTKQKLTQSFAYGNEITFPPLANSDGTKGPLVIEAEIGGHMIHRMYIDGGQIRLLVTIGDAKHCTKAWKDFVVVMSVSPYNGIIGRPGIREIQAVSSMAHGMLKFPADEGIVTIHSTILIPAECATVITSPAAVSKGVETHLENFRVAVHPNFLDQEPSDMTGVPRSIAEHQLNIREINTCPTEKRGQAPERTKAIQAEVQKLVTAGILREVYYHDWLFNPIMIQMAESDEEKKAFHTSQGVYCYTKMPFGMKNAGATYQRLVDNAFDNQVGRNMEVYVDDLVIKSHTETEILRDIDETFRTLRKINMKLNPKKCTFRAVEGVFLGYTITPEGIKPCPEKTGAVLQHLSPRMIKEVQSLNGKLASLNRFLSKSAEKYLSLFKTLKKCIKKSYFHWTPEADQAFKHLKQHMSELPLLVAPKPQEELIMYLSASFGAISAVLIMERGTVQTPVYFISRALQGPELNYSPMEKLVLSLVFAAKRLRRTSVKGQILADFLIEKPDENQPDAAVVETPSESWTLFTDGSSCVDGSGAGLILTNPKGIEFTYALRFQFAASNNEAEYEALIAGLRIATQMGIRNLQVNVDSKLVSNQVLGTKNKKADALSKIASTSFAHLSKQVLFEVLKEKSIQEKEVTIVVEEDGLTWMTPIVEYLKDGTLPNNKKEARKLRIKARVYELMDETLYKRSFLKPWLRCVRPLQASYVIREIHNGSCSMHAGPRSVVAKAMRLGYYWPTMHRDARDMIRTCNDCQVHQPVPRKPQQPLTPITALWPFYKWGIDIAGPFPEGPGKVKFLIVAMDYFTKWIEAKAVATITGNQRQPI